MFSDSDNSYLPLRSQNSNKVLSEAERQAMAKLEDDTNLTPPLFQSQGGVAAAPSLSLSSPQLQTEQKVSETQTKELDSYLNFPKVSANSKSKDMLEYGERVPEAFSSLNLNSYGSYQN